MRHRTGQPGHLSAETANRRGPRALLLAAACGTIGIGAWAGLHVSAPETPRVNAPAPESGRPPAPRFVKAPDRSAKIDPVLIDPGVSLGPAPLPIGRSLPLAADLVRAPAMPSAPVATARAEPPAMPEPDASGDGDEVATLPLPDTQEPATVSIVTAAPLPLPRPAEFRAASAPPQDAASLPLPPADEPASVSLVTAAPMPMPRPPEFRAAPAPEQPRVAAAPAPRRARMAAAPAAPAVAPDRRSFLAKLFGMDQPSGTALAYAAPQDDVVESGRGARLSGQAVGPAPATAVYDISARTVYLPNGEKLEAHSGLGSRRDDPRYIHEPMRGPTPPHVYELALRETLFHGVQALRLNPVGGAGAIHGRVGLLAHTFMLGPNGDSNGCVSIRDYQRFLQAFLRGEIKRLVVVARMG